MDVAAGTLRIEPDRDAPAIIVTEGSITVASGPGGAGPWYDVSWRDGDDTDALGSLFGEVLAGFIADGVRAPDLNMLALAAVEFADDVQPFEPPDDIPGEGFAVTLDPDRYLANLEAEGVVLGENELAEVPNLTVVVDAEGLVTVIIVGTRSQRPSNDEAHGDGYTLTAEYGNVDPINTPSATELRSATLGTIEYPDPEESCVFRS